VHERHRIAATTHGEHKRARRYFDGDVDRGVEHFVDGRHVGPSAAKYASRTVGADIANSAVIGVAREQSGIDS
jgi:hypothetical protein